MDSNMNDPLNIRSFKEFTKSDQTWVVVTYVFCDGTIPISEFEITDFESFDPTKFGSHVSKEGSGMGGIVNIETSLSSDYENVYVDSTPDFISRQEDFNRYLILLRNPS